MDYDLQLLTVGKKYILKKEYLNWLEAGNNKNSHSHLENYDPYFIKDFMKPNKALGVNGRKITFERVRGDSPGIWSGSGKDILEEYKENKQLELF